MKKQNELSTRIREKVAVRRFLESNKVVRRDGESRHDFHRRVVNSSLFRRNDLVHFLLGMCSDFLVEDFRRLYDFGDSLIQADIDNEISAYAREPQIV